MCILTCRNLGGLAIKAGACDTSIERHIFRLRESDYLEDILGPWLDNLAQGIY